jgi:predicted porin
MSHIYIWLAIILIIIALSFSAYASAELYNNIDGYINLHQSIKNK